MRRGFSLVELSIVLVILGLLVGGILAGQSLIRASELRAVGAEYSRWQTAAHAFRDKYFAVPGDMANATAFWGRQSAVGTCLSSVSASVVGTGTCDGNGGGTVGGTSGAGITAEFSQFWRQLASAGMVEGNYTGVAGDVGGFDYVPGVNTPASKLSGGGWGTWYSPSNAGDAQNFALSYGNLFIFGKYLSNGYPGNAVLTPTEAWNIDKKLDDGKPSSGRIVAYQRNICTNSSSPTDYASDYAFTTTTPSCAFFFPRAY